MPGATKCRRRHVLSALVFFLFLTSARTSRLESGSNVAIQSKAKDLQGPAGDRKTLLDLLLKALVDSSSSSSSFQAASHPFRAERVIARRFANGGGAHYSSAAVDREAKASSSSTSRERAPRFLAASRHSGKKLEQRLRTLFPPFLWSFLLWPIWSLISGAWLWCEERDVPTSYTKMSFEFALLNYPALF